MVPGMLKRLRTVFQPKTTLRDAVDLSKMLARIAEEYIPKEYAENCHVC